MSVDYSKCWICKEKDQTANMIVPCKCDRWVHRSCLNKKRISDAAYYDHCPICNTSYNLEVKPMSKYRVAAEIIGSVLLDILVAVAIFVISSKILGTILIKCHVTYKTTSNPTLMGALTIFAIIGIISIIFGIFYISQNGVIWLDLPDFRGDNAGTVLVVIGIIVVAIASIYWIYITLKNRFERHQRAVGVKQNVVTDYLRGINNV
ncbi:hypothetical protein GPJ56_002813 [Histomonas meleagridis]|uniref:uncharacterized protein n=1 Tax=Histomonas meleagridis TaxID=135588 RepID=UPI003559CD02|nr:hypothetical protein GPJ56_002813 [Histomonas meleagridis]KAH0806329.1 hypothetical protein GO595_001017 [Histomonas meleagridis]